MGSQANQESLLGSLFNKSVILIGDHPHSGLAGKIIRVEDTPTGPGLVVSLNQEHLGIKEVFVFKAEHLRGY